VFNLTRFARDRYDHFALRSGLELAERWRDVVVTDADLTSDAEIAYEYGDAELADVTPILRADTRRVFKLVVGDRNLPRRAGSHLGKFSFRWDVAVNTTTGTDTGSAHFVAANGDRIDTTIVGTGHPTAPLEFSITDVHTISGGTGRFANAKGTFTVERVASGVTFTTSGSFDGSITSPGAAH